MVSDSSSDYFDFSNVALCPIHPAAPTTIPTSIKPTKQWQPQAQLKVQLKAQNLSTLLHGYSAFTTLRLHYGQGVLWSEHWQRLAHTCQCLGLPTPPQSLPFEETWLETKWLLLRLTVTTEGYWYSTRSVATPRPQQGVAVCVSEQQVHPQWAEHKTGNYLPYLLATKEAQNVGLFEGLLLSGTHVVDGGRTAPIFCQHHDGEYNWIVPKGGLPSVTRSALQRLLSQSQSTQSAQSSRSSSSIEERPVKLAELEQSKEMWYMWLCGSGVGLLPVHEMYVNASITNSAQHFTFNTPELKWPLAWDIAFCWPSDDHNTSFTS